MEVWKDIEGYEGLYQVSSEGRVKSLNYKRTGKERILKPVKNNNEYLRVQLWKNNKGKNHYIHRLVAEAFIPNDDPERKTQINHIREFEKTNNCIDNLEFCTSKYNCNYGTRNQRRVNKTSKPTYQYTLDGELIREWSSTAEVQRQLGYNQGNISDCCNGKRKQSYGFIWRYA